MVGKWFLFPVKDTGYWLFITKEPIEKDKNRKCKNLYINGKPVHIK